MLNGRLDILEEVIAVNEKLQATDSAVLEMDQLEVLENELCISEVDEIRVDEVAKLMAEVFSEDVLLNWSEMPLDEKTDKLNAYFIRAGEVLGISTKGVIVEPLYVGEDWIEMGYNSGDGYIHLNSYVVDYPSALGEVLDTATHEMRHQFQSEVIASPDRFCDIPKDVVDIWRYELNPENYINPEYDLQGYYEQTIECDARAFSESVLQTYEDVLKLN